MKKIFLIIFTAIAFTSCENMTGTAHEINADSLRADSLWKVAIADSINNARGGKKPVQDIKPEDTSLTDIETITSGMKEGLNKVQEGLDKVRKVTEVSSNSAKAITDGVKKTRDAVNKTLDESKKTIKGE